MAWAATASKDWLQATTRTRPSSYMSMMAAGIPPRAKLAFTPRSFIRSARYLVVAMLMAPAPVWKEKPSLNRREADITSTVRWAIIRSRGFLVSRAAPAPILAGSPMESTLTT